MFDEAHAFWLRSGALGDGGWGLGGLVVTLHESHVARASYDLTL